MEQYVSKEKCFILSQLDCMCNLTWKCSSCALYWRDLGRQSTHPHTDESEAPVWVLLCLSPHFAGAAVTQSETALTMTCPQTSALPLRDPFSNNQ